MSTAKPKHGYAIERPFKGVQYAYVVASSRREALAILEADPDHWDGFDVKVTYAAKVVKDHGPEKEA
jgi:hypothetical protein